MRKFSISQGFTLIELLVVIAMMAVLTSLGIASYAAYNGSQVVQTASSDVVNMLTTAKSQSISQVKPEGCGTSQLNGYQVTIDSVSQQYTLAAICQPTADPNISPDPNASPSAPNAVTVVSKPLPPQVTFNSSSTPTIFFAISTGTVSAPGSVTISGYGKTKTITISAEGSMSVN